MGDKCVSYTYLQGQGEEYTAECFSDIPASVLSKLNPTGEKSCCNDNETESFPSSQFGMTCEPSTETRGEEKLMSSAVDSPVRTSVRRETGRASKEQEAACGVSSTGWFAKLDQITYLWKTPQCLLFEDLESSLETWPRWGTMRNGVCLEQSTPGRFIADTGFSFWPTPMKRDFSGGTINSKKYKKPKGGMYLRYFLLLKAGGPPKTHYPNPLLSEAMMGWPTGASDLNALAMDKFQQWLNSHGKR